MAILPVFSSLLAPLWTGKWFLKPKASEKPFHVGWEVESRSLVPEPAPFPLLQAKVNQPWSPNLPKTSHPLQTQPAICLNQCVPTLIFLCCRKLAGRAPSHTGECTWTSQEAGHPMLNSRSFGMSHTSACVQVLPLTSCVA